MDNALPELHRFYELSGELFCILDAGGRIERMNPAMTRLLGEAGDEHPVWLDRVHPDDRAAAARALSSLGPATGDPATGVTLEHRYQAGEQEYVPLSWTLCAEPDTGRCYGVARDLTEVKALEERAARSDSAGTAKTEFLASMNHELRTPLNAILGYTELLSSDPTLSAKQREGLDAIKRSGEHLLLLISDILDFAKLDANKLSLSPREFLLPTFLRTITEFFEQRARQKNIVFTCQQVTRLPQVVSCDETRLRQVLLNLLSNAIKFTKKGGVILKVRYDDGKLGFQIEDTGIGIPQSHIEAIFRPFEQLRQGRSFVEGTGLGLSISSRLVRLMGGDLDVKSEVGRGSAFWFEIEPEVASNWKQSSLETPKLVGYEGPTQKLLIVDSREDHRAYLAHMLQSAGFAVVEASTGEEAVLQAREERPALVFMEMDTASLDRFETIRKLRELDEHKPCPIVTTSSSTMLGHAAAPKDEGGEGLPSTLAKGTIFELLNQHLDLTWRYQSDSGERSGASKAERAAAAEPVPDLSLNRDQLQAIYDAAIIGDIREILVILDEAGINGDITSQGRATSLGVELYMLAKGFQGKQIKERLKPYLE